MTTKPFGSHPSTAEEFTLTTVTSKPHGIIDVSFTNIGATIVSWKIGELANKKELVLGFKDGASYLSSDNPFFGPPASYYTNIQVQRLGESQIEYRKQNSRI
jgi:galactose mutarotase-like enzyme